MGEQFESASKHIIFMKNFLWNMFTIIKNGQLARRSFVHQSRKKICESFLTILWNEGFILGYTIKNSNIKISLKYKNQQPVINSIKIISHPGRRIYYSVKQLWKTNYGKSFVIVSTNKGLKSLLECKKQQLGGEPIIVIN